MSAYDVLRNLSFVEGDRTYQSDLARLAADIELERVTDLHEVDDRLGEMMDAIDNAILVSQEADDALEVIVDLGDTVDQLTYQLGEVIRELQWTDPDSVVLRDLTHALRDFNKNVVTV